MIERQILIFSSSTYPLPIQLKFRMSFFFLPSCELESWKISKLRKLVTALRDLPMSSYKTLAKRLPDKLGFSEASVLQIQYRMSAFTQRVLCKYTISVPRGREKPVLPWYVSC